MAAKQILERMLSRIPNTMPKHEGSFYHDVLASAANELSVIDDAVIESRNKISVENLTGDELTQRVNERSGVERKQATYATGQVTVTGTGTINNGDMFETQSGTQFKSIETKAIVANGTINIEAVIAGNSGNVPANTVSLFPVTLSGFTAVTNNSPTIDGFNMESDVDLLKRYYDKVRSPATSNNITHFKSWANSVSGVGDSRVMPVWDGVNTVKVIIINASKQPASQAIIDDVKNYIDPTDGLGEGQASAGSVVTVVPASGLGINIEADIVISSGYDPIVVEATIVNNLANLLSGIAFVESIVSYARIGSTVLNTDGVSDYSNLLVNGDTSNISVEFDEVAIVGTVTINVT